ncbi:hypothetical protein LTR10_007630 [Elasticomyces elasticus]|nr:hypothetical protein LTR10_007630 [Elasticomyces elasticus]KAK4970632.1 hypothetical protein LTR42_007607 [Elasticomyces elasticus]
MRFNLPPGQGPPQSPQQFRAQGQQTPQCAAIPATQQVPMQGTPKMNYGQYNAMPTTPQNQFIGNQQQMSVPIMPQPQNMFFGQDNNTMTNFNNTMSNFDAGKPHFTAQAQTSVPAVGLGIANQHMQQGQQQRMPMTPQAQNKSFGQHTPNMGTPTRFTNVAAPTHQMQQMQSGVKQQFQPAIQQQSQPAVQQQFQHTPNPGQPMSISHQQNINALTPQERFELANSPVYWPGTTTPMGTIDQVRQARPDLQPMFLKKLAAFAGKKAMERLAAEMAKCEAQNLAFHAQQQAAMLAQAQSMQYTHNAPATPSAYAQTIVRPQSAAMSQPSPTPNQNAMSNSNVPQGMGQHLAQVRAELTRRSGGTYTKYEDDIIAAMDSTDAGQEMSRRWAASLNMAHNNTGSINQAGSVPQASNTMQAPSGTPRAKKMAKPSPAKPRAGSSGMAATATPPQPKTATPQRKRSAPTDFESNDAPAKKNRVEQPASGITDAGFSSANAECRKRGQFLDIGTKNNGVHCHDCCANIRQEGRCVWQRAGYHMQMNGVKVHPQLQALIVGRFKVCKEMKEKSPNDTCPCSPHHIAPPARESQSQAKESVQPSSTSSLPSLEHGAGTPSPIALSQPITPPARSNLAQTYSIGQAASSANSNSTGAKRKHESSTITIDDGDDTALTTAKRQKMTADMIAAVSPGSSRKADVIDISDDEEVATQSAPSKCTTTPLTGNDKILPRDRANSVLSPTTTTTLVLDNNNNVTQASAPVSAPSPAKCSGPAPFSAQLTQWLESEKAKNAVPVKRAYSPRKPSVPKQKQVAQDMTVQTAELTHITEEGFLVGQVHVTGPMAGYREVKMMNATRSAVPTVPRPARLGQTFVEGLGYQNRLPDVNDPIEMILHRYLAPAVKFARLQDSPVQLWAHGVAPDWNDFGEHVERKDSFGLRGRARRNQNGFTLFCMYFEQDGTALGEYAFDNAARDTQYALARLEV